MDPVYRCPAGHLVFGRVRADSLFGWCPTCRLHRQMTLATDPEARVFQRMRANQPAVLPRARGTALAGVGVAVPPSDPPASADYASLPERIRSQVSVRRKTDCWTWTGGRARSGYGRLEVAGRTWRIHRLVYELLVGSIPTGLTIDHLCSNKLCVNPAHLEPVSAGDNVRRYWLRRRPGTYRHTKNGLAKTHCVNGHAFTPENTYVWPDGRRRCLICRHASDERVRAAKSDAAFYPTGTRW